MKRSTVVIALAAICTLSACSTVRLAPGGITPAEFRAHVLMFDSRGEPRDPIARDAGNYAYLAAEHTPARAVASGSYDAYIDHILQEIERRRQTTGGPVRVIFFFHGGLNSRAAALERAEQQIARMKAEAPAVYPIFVNWQTSLPASYKDHLLFVTKGQDTYTLGQLLAPVKLVDDLGHAVTELVPNNFLYLKDGARKLTYIREGAVQADGCPVAALDFREGSKNPNTGGFLDKTHAFVTYVLTKWWVAGALDGGGTPAWSSMLYTADRLFYSDQEMHHPYQYVETDSTGSGAFSHFLRRLTTVVKREKGDDVVLAAHSAGSIVANTVVTLFGDMLPITNLVYMAPACTIDELMRGGRIATFLSGHPERQLYILTLHEVAELSEQWYLDITPRGSLLVWLDEFIQPKSSEFRGQMLGRARNLRIHAHLIPCDIQPQIHITAFSERPVTGHDPQTHSEVGGIAYWNPSQWRPNNPALRQICMTSDPQKMFDVQGGDGTVAEPCVRKEP